MDALAEDTVLQPNVLVAERANLTERDLAAAPVLAVEVLSPSTRLIDLTLKRVRYEAAGTSSYWVVDPEEPAVTAWELVTGRYVEVADVTGTENVCGTGTVRRRDHPGRADRLASSAGHV
ncbi:Uma2 family endonuclease [Georgenia yuyongxinii]|uniref:Uma2 family endonuclease n=1 Tax=Georgenia yuyongxinii TaxID=2589797 RepID=A0A552WNH2_9MICO|nr:Uma2 family endonuclease [Georgenia yuyongxinii]TRW44257.1 Uma2 family endonuclease [Georgenia yuyongxinii]